MEVAKSGCGTMHGLNGPLTCFDRRVAGGCAKPNETTSATIQHPSAYAVHYRARQRDVSVDVLDAAGSVRSA